jgi:hypothetical protein
MAGSASSLDPRNRYENRSILGKVVKNDDPNMLCRVKVSCPELYGNATDDQLPWASPKSISSIGSTANDGSFGVPEIGSIVTITLQNGDPHFPEYNSTPRTPETVPELFKTNYPNRYGRVDNKGNYHYYDKQSGDYEFYHKSGTKMHISDDGTFVLTSSGGTTITIEGDTGKTTVHVTDQLDINVDGAANIVAQDELKLQGSNVRIHGATIYHEGAVEGNSTADYSGDVTAVGTSVHTHTHGGVDTGSGTSGPPT